MMCDKLIDMIASHEIVNVAVETNGVNCCFIVDIDEYERNGNNLMFGNADQEICIHNISKCNISEDFDEMYIVSEDKNTAISLCFIR